MEIAAVVHGEFSPRVCVDILCYQNAKRPRNDFQYFRFERPKRKFTAKAPIEAQGGARQYTSAREKKNRSVV